MAELSISQKLQALYALQVVDSKIDQIRVIKGELPIQLKDLEDELEGLNTRLVNHETAIKGFEGDVIKLKNTVKDCETLIVKYEKQQENVKNNREFEALTKEIEMQKLEIQLCEKRQKDAAAKITERKQQLEVTRKKAELKAKERDSKKVELDKIIKETEAEEREISTSLDSLRSPIEPRLLVAYDKIRKAYRNGLGVVKVERNSCGGCFSKVPAQLQLEIATRKKIIVCEGCGRVLVDEGIESEVIEYN